MFYPAPRLCSNPEAAGFDRVRAAGETWQAMLGAEVFQEGNFRFASGLRATLKANAENLYAHPKQLEVVLGHFATFPCVEEADVLLYVPDGWRDFMTELGKRLEKPVAHSRRVPGSASRYDFEFMTPEDKELALSAVRPVIGEDVVTTLGSVAGMRKLLPPDQDVHSLAMLRRGTVKPEYRVGLTDHYLLEREIPTDSAEFRRRMANEWRADT